MTLEQCEELLRRDPVACARLYGKIKSEVMKMEVRESEHRWMIRRALADGPKTAMQASNWARQQGDQHMDRPLAESILRNLIREEEVGIDVTVNAGKPPVFVATDRMKSLGSVPSQIENRVTLPSTPATELCPGCGGLMLDGSKTCRRCYETPAPAVAAAPPADPEPRRLTVSEIIALCTGDEVGKRRTVGIEVESGTSMRVASQNLRLSLNSRSTTRAWKWSVHVVRKHVLAVAKVGMRGEPTAPQTPAIETPAPRVEPIVGAADGNATAPPAITHQQTDWTVPPPPGKPWVAGRAALAEVDGRIAKLIEMRGALLRVIPMMETAGI